MGAQAESIRQISGLSEQEAQRRLLKEGYNELPRPGRRTPFRIVLEVLREPMLSLLLVGGLVYFLLGDVTEALVLMTFAVSTIVVTVVQETRTERVLEALQDLTSPRALVIRDGQRRRIAGREVARGDVVILGEGDRVPADGYLLQAREFQADESLLTGESVPVGKSAVSDPPGAVQRPGGDGLPFVFSGSLIVRGNGMASITATGKGTEIGRIGHELARVEAEPPRLRRQTARLVRLCAVGGISVSVLAVVLYVTFRGGWLDAMLAGIAIGMSMLPEEFPVVLTVFMAMGAWRISKARVLTRKSAAIETLGSATVLCTDKTGTLTENRMRVAELWVSETQSLELDELSDDVPPPAFHDLIAVSRLACLPDPFDPMEAALHRLAEVTPDAASNLPSGARELVHSYGLRPELLATTQVWQFEGHGDRLVAAKGAPEAVARLCRMSGPDRTVLETAVNALAARGLRVLAVAVARDGADALPEGPDGFGFDFLGLVGLRDPLRPGVTEAVGECRLAGIRVLMITGDYPATASAIARQAGLGGQDIVTGAELDEMDDTELSRRTKDADVFARILPEQKLRIVNALKADGEVVAMTGDGVNDAPSLKAAHIGVAMGGRGTDVAREASAIVLLDDDFGSIVTAIRLGRRIYDNLRKAMGFIFAVHVPIAGLALMPLALGLPIIFGPIHIAFLEMVIDPVCSLAFESETDERDVMDRPPRRPDSPLFSWPLITWSVLQGGLAFSVVAILYLAGLQANMADDEARALAFLSLVLSIVSLILVNRSFSTSLLAAFRRRNRTLTWILLAVFAILALALFWPPAAGLFGFGQLHLQDILIAAGAGGIVLLVLEALKPIWRKHLRR